MNDMCSEYQDDRSDEIDNLKKELKSNIEWMIHNNMLSDAKKSIAEYEKMNKCNDIDIYSMKSVIAIQESEFEAAALLLLEAFTMDRHNFDILYNLAYVYNILHDNNAAKRFLVKAFKACADEEHRRIVYEMLENLGEGNSIDLLNLAQKDNDDVIYILCPGGMATGGPELLHQLCYKLNLIGYEVYMYYYSNPENPVHERYKKYGNKYVTKIINTESSIIIMPEILARYTFSMEAKKIIIWWLSVDNFCKSLSSTSVKEDDVFNIIRKRDQNKRLLHFAQSHYAIDYLKQNGIRDNEIYYLSDYINDEFVKASSDGRNEQYRYPNILYNPIKGYEFTSKIIKASPELNWIPLRNYTPEEMRILMNRSRVYIDFGDHPGKDRIPREAVLCGLCILTGRRGAAANEVDIPISDEYKILDRDENIQQIINKIKEMIENYEIEVKAFEDYKNIIIQEEYKFEKDIRMIFESNLFHCL